MVAKADECDIPGCVRIATRVIDHDLQVCKQCYEKKGYINCKTIRNSRKDPHESPLNPHKMEKIIETYLDLANTIQRAGGCVSVIQDHRHKPLSVFLENVCSTNNIRFKHNKKGS